jgi:DNA-binding NarL/FixJ family response regulator
MRILIADDHAVFREGLRHLLTGLGDADPDIVEAGTLAETLAALAGETRFDLVLCDLGMPGMEPVVGVAEVKGAAGSAPVVIVSASESPNDIRAAFTAGANGYIPKTVRGARLLAALQLVLEDAVYVRPTALDVLVGAVDSAADNATKTLRETLTDRQVEVLRQLAAGKPNKEIARELNLAEGTVRVHVNAVLKALSARNRTEAALVARNAGLA